MSGVLRLAQSSQRLRAARWVGAVLLLLATVSAGAEIPLRGEWLKGGEGINARSIAAGEHDAQFAAFIPAHVTVFPRNPDGAWLRLHAKNGVWPEVPLSVVVRNAGLEQVTLYQDQQPVWTLHALIPPPPGLQQGHGRLHFPLDEALQGPILLRLEPAPTRPSRITFGVLARDDFVVENDRWLALASACFAIMVAMAVVALFFASILRDVTFLYYAGYVVCFCMILLLQSGYVVSPLGWQQAWAHFPWLGRTVTGLSVFLATLFLDRFATLRRYSPRGRWAVLAVGYAVLILMLSGSLPFDVLQKLPRLLINPLLVLAVPILLAVSIRAYWRGSTYAGIFLLGWTPLLLFTMVDSAGFAALSHVTWLREGMLVAGALEALVLSLGLAGRALALRHERDLARMLADTDPLTALLNRRAWARRLETMLTRARALKRPLSLLFLDLDRFKSLNDTHGHEAGDRALRALAQLIHTQVLPRGLAGRYGGEEFVVALPGQSKERAQEHAQRIRQALLKLAIPVDHDQRILDVSIGVSELERGDDAASLIGRADQAMYECKQGRQLPPVSSQAASNKGHSKRPQSDY